jgi:metabolite-proton symporter
MVGTTIEFYDFYVYATAAVLVFPQLFFKTGNPTTALLASFAVFGAAMVARPIGAIFFGHLGDRRGRKTTLVISLLVMGIATFLIGCLPTYSSVGVLAPFLLLVLRLTQGFALGGEWSGAALVATENAPAGKRAWYGTFPQLGAPLGFIIANGIFLIINFALPHPDGPAQRSEAFLAWGWRVPFIGSVVLVAVGLYVRLAITETAAFMAREKTTSTRMPVMEVLSTHTGRVLLGAGSTMAVFAFFYIGVTYLTSYGTQELGLPRTTVLAMGIIGGLVFAATTIAGAILSDRVGRRKMIIIGNASAIVGGIIAFPILDIGTAWAFGLGLSLVLGVVGIAYGPQGAQLPELFPTHYRYTGAGLSYNLAGVLGGGVVPLIATALVAGLGSSLAIGALLAGLSVISLLCTIALPDTNAESIAYTAVAPATA